MKAGRLLIQCRFLSTTRYVLDKSRFVPSTGIYPIGFNIGGIHCGVKKDPSKLDLALLVSDDPCSAAAVFTTNMFKAAPVQVSQEVLEATENKDIRAIIINSGNANAVTGDDGITHAESMVDMTDVQIGCDTDNPATLVMSTGVIGQKLPIQNILRGIEELVTKEHLGSSHVHWLTGANAICTTDTFPKLKSREFSIGGNTYRIAGLAKGAGMIHPNMATLLGFFVTDAPVAPGALNEALKYAVSRSFNSISVDGDTSTNDTVAALANGMAGGVVIELSDSERYLKIREVITEFAQDLAKLVVRDGEGATKFVTISVEDAATFEDAKQIANSIATSALVKTALYGKDANWGRILCAMGYSGVEEIEPSTTCVSFIPSDGSEELKLLVNGEPEQVDETRASEILEMEDLEIRVSLGTGNHSAVFWTCDFSHE